MQDFSAPVEPTEQKSSMMRFLKSFFLTLRERFFKGESRSSTDLVGLNELLSRYALMKA